MEQHGSSAADVLLRFVGVAAAGAVAMAVAAGCGDDSSGSGSDGVPLGGSASEAPASGETTPGEVPYVFLPVDSPEPIPENSPWRDVSIEVESVPDVAEPGTTLRFAVAVANESDRVVDPAQHCPSYFMSFGESSEAVIPGLSRLNCGDAGTIQPGDVQRFAMAIDLPPEFDLGAGGAGSVYWRLEPSILDASSDEIRVGGSSP